MEGLLSSPTKFSYFGSSSLISIVLIEPEVAKIEVVCYIYEQEEKVLVRKARHRRLHFMGISRFID